ncbi:MAG: hypothetical protein ACJ8FU_09705 [Xanthobacteraceae bacterium]
MNDLSFETRPAGAPQDEVYRSDPHGVERREATRLEPQDLGRSLYVSAWALRGDDVMLDWNSHD